MSLLIELRDPYKPQGELRPLCLRAADEIERLSKLVDLHKENNKAVFAACEAEIERLKS